MPDKQPFIPPIEETDNTKPEIILKAPGDPIIGPKSFVTSPGGKVIVAGGKRVYIPKV